MQLLVEFCLRDCRKYVFLYARLRQHDSLLHITSYTCMYMCVCVYIYRLKAMNGKMYVYILLVLLTKDTIIHY